MFVTIPCFDEPDLLATLESLAACTPPVAAVTVIVVVNSSDHASPEILIQNINTIESVQTWWETCQKPFYRLQLLHAPALPAKWAGVGWARKIAMDTAISCLDKAELDEGILIALDADSTVSTGYLTSIESTFQKNPGYQFVNLHFAHPVDDAALSPSLRDGTILYELYLRYLRNAMHSTGYPHAIHTVGSSFAVKATAYVKQGGMNRRQAGEDFHFLHKMILLGDYGQVQDATVFPAARISHRVPFGTGAALKKWEEGDNDLVMACSLAIFKTLQPLFSDPGYFFTTDESEWQNWCNLLEPNLAGHVRETETLQRISELKKNCSDNKNFTRRFFHLVNAFWIIQYLNLCENKEGGKGELIKEATGLLAELNLDATPDQTPRELLEIYRQIDKKFA